VRVALRGTRGSLPSPGPDTSRYGGNTSCVEVQARPDTLLMLDAGTGIRRLGEPVTGVSRVDVLLTHLHMDHIVGLGFFGALFQPDLEVHIWGPPSTTQDLHARLTRYLSPPLFPVRLRDLPCRLTLHDIPRRATVDLPGISVTADFVCHPGPTLGYRVSGDGGVLAYLPDHEPALSDRGFPSSPEWTSGFDLAAGADVLIHDAQYSEDEYEAHVGWGHSSIAHAMAFAEMAGVSRLLAFHHDPDHGDAVLDKLQAEAAAHAVPFDLSFATEGAVYQVGEDGLSGNHR
jgi:phosphoribosyl 1,2-cyclic phosphodiesterase